jgi:hypothetical protein
MCSIDSYDDDVSGDVVADVDLTHARPPPAQQAAVRRHLFEGGVG